ncbi:uncharacterized protein EV154DRAFT_583819 [Mucor mucedo]|uniref:uncharacterized protein n=1 Tax=Mucor mucedo TaxID=29922 RepID=UPI002220B645|nr:uncharacterized protein EV154DRAFT_583819 [Mucor mucedo]KAI7893313.1 hypothetical protein EV154DRAFT_583819 [Mucor mucedo]
MNAFVFFENLMGQLTLLVFFLSAFSRFWGKIVLFFLRECMTALVSPVWLLVNAGRPRHRNPPVPIGEIFVLGEHGIQPITAITEASVVSLSSPPLPVRLAPPASSTPATISCCPSFLASPRPQVTQKPRRCYSLDCACVAGLPCLSDGLVPERCPLPRQNPFAPSLSLVCAVWQKEVALGPARGSSAVGLDPRCEAITPLCRREDSAASVSSLVSPLGDCPSLAVSFPSGDNAFPAVSFPSGDNAVVAVSSPPGDNASFAVSSPSGDNASPAVSFPSGDNAVVAVSSPTGDNASFAVSFPSGDNVIPCEPSLMESIASFLVTSSLEDDIDPAVFSPIGDNASPSVVGGPSVGFGCLEVPPPSPCLDVGLEWPDVGSLSPSLVHPFSALASPVVAPPSFSPVSAEGLVLEELESLQPSSVNLASPAFFPRPSLRLSSAGAPSEELRSPSLSPLLRKGNLASPVFRPPPTFRELVDAATLPVGMSLLPKTPDWSPVASSSAIEDTQVGAKRRSRSPSPPFSPRRRVGSLPAEDTFSLPPPALSSSVSAVVASSPSAVSSAFSAASVATVAATPSSVFSAAAVASVAIASSSSSPVVSDAPAASAASVASSPVPVPFSSCFPLVEPVFPWWNLRYEKFRDPLGKTAFSEPKERRKSFFTRPPGRSRL